MSYQDMRFERRRKWAGADLDDGPLLDAMAERFDVLVTVQLLLIVALGASHFNCHLCTAKSYPRWCNVSSLEI